MSLDFCQLAIAIHKQAFLKFQLLNEIPPLLFYLSGKAHGDSLYWKFTDLEWSHAKAQMEAFFQKLEKESAIDIYIDESKSIHVPLYTKACFGAIRLTDQQDTQFWGNPSEYGLQIAHHIELPNF